MQYLSVILVVLGLDQLTKFLVVSSLSLYEQIEVIPGFFNLVYVTNPGAAFSMLADIDSPWRHYFFVTVGCLALVFLTIYWFQLRQRAPMQGLAIALIAGGALGNLVDRLRTGAVIDFIDLYWRAYHWPAFNIADSAICIGVGFFLVLGFKEKNTPEKHRR